LQDENQPIEQRILLEEVSEGVEAGGRGHDPERAAYSGPEQPRQEQSGREDREQPDRVLVEDRRRDRGAGPTHEHERPEHRGGERPLDHAHGGAGVRIDFCAFLRGAAQEEHEREADQNAEEEPPSDGLPAFRQKDSETAHVAREPFPAACPTCRPASAMRQIGPGASEEPSLGAPPPAISARAVSSELRTRVTRSS
jgi:hypothetical protein